MNITEKLELVRDCKSDIKDAIEAKGVSVGDAPFDEYATKIGEISGGAEEAPENDVNFYDYTGFRVASYTIAEAKALTALPTPPSHEGLTFQGWNWSLADIQGYNRQYIDIGANYAPNDGNTHLKIIATSTDISLEITVYKGSLVIDYGDGTSDSYSNAGRYDKIFTHSYATTGAKEITLSFTQSANDGFCGLHSLGYPNIWYGFYLYELNLGHYTDTSVYCPLVYIFHDCIVSVPTYLFNIIKSGNGFIRQITIPKNSDFAITGQYPFGGCYKMKPCLPPLLNTTDSFGMFNGMGITRVVLPETTTATQYSNNIFAGLQTPLLSLPSTASWTAAASTYSSILEYIDIVQGWVPNYSMTLNSSSRWSAENIVKFFTKLGTTQTTITLTFGSSNLNKLTAEQKAIATGKGYTLA